MSMIDSAITVIAEAQVRNFQRWPILDQYVWPNAYVGGSFENEIDYLTDWITDRLEWMDEQAMRADDDPQLILSYRLDPAYPNPFNPTTTIGLAIPYTTFVTVKIYDIAGREIITLMNGDLVAGQHTMTWDGSEQSSGVYFVHLKSDDFTQTRKIMLMK